jgi:hypothetical protein
LHYPDYLETYYIDSWKSEAYTRTGGSTGITITGVNRLANQTVTVIRAVEGTLLLTVIGNYTVSTQGTALPFLKTSIELLPFLVTLRNKISLDLLPGITQIDSILPPISCLCHAMTSCIHGLVVQQALL